MFEIIDMDLKGIISIPYLKIEANKLTVILGPSGCGKTSLLKLLNKLISPDSGDIYYCGKNLKDINSLELRKEVVMLSQNSPLFPESIKDNLKAALNYHMLPIPEDFELREILKQVGINKDLDDKILFLSGGEKSRVALARVLVLDPQVYLLDEPGASLDEKTEIFITEMLMDICQKKGKTMVMVTHSKEIARKYGDVIIDLKEYSRG